MASKTPTINLIDWRKIADNSNYEPEKEKHFKVESLKNTIDYRPKQYLTSEEAQDLINKGWNVNIRGTKDSDF